MKRLILLLLALATPAYAIEGFTELQSISTSAASEVGSAIGRTELSIINTDTANPVCCGYSASQTCSGGTNTDGQRIAAGAGYRWDAVFQGSYLAESSIYCRASGSAVTITYDQVRK